MSRKRLPVWRTLLVMLSDVAAIAAGLLLAYEIRFHSVFAEWVPIVNGFDHQLYIRTLPLACAVWFFALRLENLYRRRSRIFDFNIVRRIVTGSILALLILIAFTFYGNRVNSYSRVITPIVLASVVGCLVLTRLVLHWIFRWMLVRRGLGQSRTVLVGGGALLEHVASTLLRHPEHGFKPIGVVLPTGQSMPAGLDLPVLGCLEDHFETLLLRHQADEVIFTGPGVAHDRIPELLLQCERAFAEWRMVPETSELILTGMRVETTEGIPLLGVRETPLQGWMAALKRMIDVVAASVGLVITAPLVMALAWVVRLQDGGPAFYRQERMGIDGRLFKIIKLRTMRPDAETMSGPTFASDRDPRCTRLGWLLRRTHIDELPQLLNVLRGEMSLVGPRPERPYFIQQFRDHVPRYMARHKVRSGITGWAQVNGLCGLHGSIDERIKYDLYYIENWSLWLDFKILMLTLFGRVRPGPHPIGH